jgi:hypothetical protein
MITVTKKYIDNHEIITINLLVDKTYNKTSIFDEPMWIIDQISVSFILINILLNREIKFLKLKLETKKKNL